VWTLAQNRAVDKKEVKYVGQSTKEQMDRPAEGHGSQPQPETDDASFAEQRDRQDPEASELDKIDNIEDFGDDTLDTDAARDLGGGEGDFR
jgi:hypothetical protein